jgi:hypothetical protein
MTESPTETRVFGRRCRCGTLAAQQARDCEWHPWVRALLPPIARPAVDELEVASELGLVRDVLARQLHGGRPVQGVTALAYAQMVTRKLQAYTAVVARHLATDSQTETPQDPA